MSATRQHKFRTNGTALSPITGAANTAKAITSGVTASREEIASAVGTLSVGGVATFATKNVADSGGFTSVFVQRIA